eukprot:scaffold36275_cov154-Isochrysis_galbana.AAC.9
MPEIRTMAELTDFVPPEATGAPAGLAAAVPPAGAAMSSKYCASCRAVGWSKISVEGSDCPDSCCSWLPSSTDPSESRPDSISGASGSTLPPVVWRRASMMNSRLTVFVPPAASVTAPPAAFL